MFTIFDIKDEKLFNEDNVVYAIYQKEIAPTTQKIHYQGYIEFKKPM